MCILFLDILIIYLFIISYTSRYTLRDSSSFLMLLLSIRLSIYQIECVYECPLHIKYIIFSFYSDKKITFIFFVYE